MHNVLDLGYYEIRFLVLRAGTPLFVCTFRGNVPRHGPMRSQRLAYVYAVRLWPLVGALNSNLSHFHDWPNCLRIVTTHALTELRKTVEL